MVKVRETSVRRRVLGEVRNELKNRAPTDGYKAYDATLLSGDVRKAFEKVADGCDTGAPITVNDVVDRYATDLKANLSTVNSVGPTWLTAKEAGALEKGGSKSRVVAVRDELARGKKSLSMAALKRNAALFITDHSAPVGDSGNAINVLFPAFDVGNGEAWHIGIPGIDAHILKDKKGNGPAVQTSPSGLEPRGKSAPRNVRPEQGIPRGRSGQR